MEDQENDFEYSNEDATEIILENISMELWEKLGFEDVVKLLELKDEYFKLVGIIQKEGEESICTYPISLDEHAMNLYIMTNAILKHKIVLTIDEVEEIMQAELIYLAVNGQIDDDFYLN